jgi:hypothetical protein
MLILGFYVCIAVGSLIVVWAAMLQWRGTPTDAVAPAKPLDMMRSLRDEKRRREQQDPSQLKESRP